MTKALKQYYIIWVNPKFDSNLETLVVAYTPKEAREIFVAFAEAKNWTITNIINTVASRKKWSNKRHTKEEFYQKELAEIERFKKFHIR